MSSATQTKKGTVSGFGYFIKGLGLITKPGVKRYVAIPLIINIVIFVVMILVVGGYVNDLVTEYTPDTSSWWSWLSWIGWLVKILFYMLAFLIMFYTFTFVANIIGAPFNGPLSAAVEKYITQQAPPGSTLGIMAEVGASIKNEGHKWIYFFMLAIPVAIVTGILSFTLPFLIPVIWYIFGSWMFSLEYLEYPMGNYGLTFKETKTEIAKKRMMSMGFGGAVTLGTMIPLFNFIVMPVAVAGATAMRVEQYPMSKK